MNGRDKRRRKAERARNTPPITRPRDPFGGLCPNGCGKPGPHFVPPSLGESGFYICTSATPPTPDQPAQGASDDTTER